MSVVSGETVDLLNNIAQLQQDLADGKPIDFESVFNLSGFTPAEIKAAFGRTQLNGMVSSLVDKTLGDAMTVGDETAIAAAWERAMHTGTQSRIKKMAYVRGRCTGHGSSEGILRYGMQEMMARPE